ncbi:MAG: hypothetical protein ABI399_07115, partial [Bauldia sp.]
MSDVTQTLSATVWAASTTISGNAGDNDTLDVVADNNDISADLTLPTLSSIETGNLIGTAGTDTITLTGEQLDAIIIGTGTIDLGDGTGDTINLTSTSLDLNLLGASDDGGIQGVEAISAATAAGGVEIDLSGQSEGFTLTGSAQADTLTGGDGGDTMTGGGGADTLTGNAGNDIFNLANGDFVANESIDGGADTDAIVLTEGMAVDFSAGTISNVETLTGSSDVDTVTMFLAQWGALTTIDLGDGADTLNVIADGSDISLLTGPTVSNVETGNLVGTDNSDSVTLKGEQLDAILIGTGTIDLGDGAADTINLTSTSADLNAAANGDIVNVE